MSINEPNAGEGGGGTASRLRDKAAGLADGAKQQASHFYDNKKSTLVGEIGHFASILRQAGDSGEAGFAGRLAGLAAERIEAFTAAADDKDLDDLLRDLESFARRSPAVFVGSAMAIGFLVSRFVKSSARELSAGARRTDVEGHYSSEAYGGYRGGMTDSAMGSDVGSGLGSGLGSTTGATGTTSGKLGSTGSTGDLGSTGNNGGWGTGGGAI